MSNEIPSYIELRQRLFQMTPTQRRILISLGVLLLLVVPVLTYLLVAKMIGSDRGWTGAFQFVYERFHRDPFRGLMYVLLLLVLVLQLAFLLSAYLRERLILSPEGIRYVSPMPGWLHFLLPGWFLRWDQVQTASISLAGAARGPRGPVLVLEGAGRQHRVYPWLWVDDATPVDTSLTIAWRRLISAGPSAIEAAVDDSPVMRYIAINRPNLQLERGAANAEPVFALESNPQTLFVVIAFFVFGFYALIDGLFVRSEVYTETPFYTAFIAIGLLVALVVWRWLARGEVPRAEAIALAVMLGLSVAAAAHPGALRVNAMTDSVGLQTYKYVRTTNGDYRPIQSELPVLTFTSYLDYWTSFADGSVYEFQLRKGGLGFYQLNMKPVNDAMRDYYQTYRY